MSLCWRNEWTALARRLALVLPVALGALLLPTALHVLPSVAVAVDDDLDDEDEDPYRPSLIARFRDASGGEAVRLQETLAQDWGSRAPDRRLRPGPFTAEFEGRLWTQAPGEYRLHVYAAGDVQLEFGGKLLLDEHADTPQWLSADPIDLPYGYHPLRIRFQRDQQPAQLKLYWEGPRFGLEPVAGRWLFHDREKTPPDDFERGETLVRALRCAACHALPGEPEALPAPALTALEGNVSRPWLVDWLSNTDQAAGSAGSWQRRMPHFAFDKEQAEDVADALLSASDQRAHRSAKDTSPGKPGKKPKREASKSSKDEPAPSVAAGATLLRSLGCLACHRVGELGEGGPFGGGDLSRVAEKRPADFFARWLKEPASLNRDHRMPLFPLDASERESLSLYLQTLGEAPSPVELSADEVPTTAAKLIQQARCAACHALPKPLAGEESHAAFKLKLDALSQDDGTCLGEPDARSLRPGYRLSAQDRRAIRIFLQDIADEVPAPPAGERLLAEHNCLACHARGASEGLGEHLPLVAEVEPELRDVLPALSPPALFGVGDKLQDKALAEALEAPQPPRRPWLHVRMPKFHFSPEETDALVDYFVAADRIPPRTGDALADVDPLPSEVALDAAGARLVTAEGFGCTSCHAIGKWTPEKVALGAHGSALSEIGKRVRREWFDRWVRNPSRIVPRMEMPAVEQSIRGVLDERRDAQLAAVWRALNRPGFTPPTPNALRVVRRANLPEIDQPAAVLTDVIEVGNRPFIKPLVIGLDNRHNVLFDLATGRLAAWWIGDVARQRTRGKSWFWEGGLPQLLPVFRESESASSDLALVEQDEAVAASRQGQYVTEFDMLEHVDGGVRFSMRLHFPDSSVPTVGVVEQYTSLRAADGQSGFRRRVEIDPAPADVAWQLMALAGDVQVSADGSTASLSGPSGRLHVTLAEGSPLKLVKTPRGAAVAIDPAKETTIPCTLDYRSEAAPGAFAPLPELDRSVEPAQLEVVPGCEVVRLPLTDQVMPTGLCWRPDGTLVVTSLEGRVWLGHDRDGDALEDELVPFSDDLAAPYGAAAAGEAIDVINKYGLLRLFDEDGDGRAERTVLLASGWGHTRDYHDWAVGLPRDAAGNYYVSLPCQQDKRSEVAAHLRGRVVQLVPREPTDDDPRRFSIDELCAGLRFPQGIALSPGEELFVTDNQGNYTPFNELNHVVRGARYGFLNRLEVQAGLNPPFRPAAIEIPHPWTRSVNGICFLVPPEGSDQEVGDLFGPFAGHLIGCEYDTRRLVRMSLQRVGDAFQGAVYPFSAEPPADGETFEGPLVCQVAPDGALYVGNIRDSGWGAGSNTGSIVRVRFGGDLPAGIAEVRAVPEGFEIAFTTPVDRARAGDASNYTVASYRRIPTPRYGGPDQDRRVEKIRWVHVSDDARRVTLHFDDLREGFVYELHVQNLTDGQPFFPDEAYYTLRHRVAPGASE
ncbi:MAG: hypothetical protein DWQ37_17735 [Planctomycetota bacterium]|nr:MAG: hypothetical protein DWQ37_17735 [Planctomycetota bacterium]